MPQKRLIRRTASRDIDAIRAVVRQGVPWLPSDQHLALTAYLSDEQRALLAHLTPYRNRDEVSQPLPTHTRGDRGRQGGTAG
jgi:hypothetical protein